MIGFDAVLKEISALDAAELTMWIDSGWVRPEGERGNWQFHEVDVARARLIAEIRYDLAIDAEAVPVLLSLLDQLYGLRRELGALCGAVAAQPEAIRHAIAAALRGRDGGPE
jgi:chaperone modulatory protein CbpM